MTANVDVRRVDVVLVRFEPLEGRVQSVLTRQFDH